MWPNGYFTSSVVVIARRHRPRPPPPSSTVVLVVHHVRQYVKNLHFRILPVTSTDFLRKIYPQFTYVYLSSAEVSQHFMKS